MIVTCSLFLIPHRPTAKHPRAQSPTYLARTPDNGEGPSFQSQTGLGENILDLSLTIWRPKSLHLPPPQLKSLVMNKTNNNYIYYPLNHDLRISNHQAISSINSPLNFNDDVNTIILNPVHKYTDRQHDSL